MPGLQFNQVVETYYLGCSLDSCSKACLYTPSLELPLGTIGSRVAMLLEESVVWFYNGENIYKKMPFAVDIVDARELSGTLVLLATAHWITTSISLT